MQASTFCPLTEGREMAKPPVCSILVNSHPRGQTKSAVNILLEAQLCENRRWRSRCSEQDKLAARRRPAPFSSVKYEPEKEKNFAQT
jgi:hypothetical protein